MARERYRNEVGTTLNYSDSGGPIVEPGAEFEHDIPHAQRESHLRAGFITRVPAPAIVDDDLVADEMPF